MYILIDPLTIRPAEFLFVDFVIFIYMLSLYSYIFTFYSFIGLLLLIIWFHYFFISVLFVSFFISLLFYFCIPLSLSFLHIFISFDYISHDNVSYCVPNEKLLEWATRTHRCECRIVQPCNRRYILKVDYFWGKEDIVPCQMTFLPRTWRRRAFSVVHRGKCVSAVFFHSIFEKSMVNMAFPHESFREISVYPINSVTFYPIISGNDIWFWNALQ